ncbi:MAG: DUF6458 family protein [Egibacteraceae bacterium]
MTIGGGIAMIVLGAILTYAVEFDIAGINIDVIGIILIIGGLIGLVFGLVTYFRATQTRDRVVERPVERPVERRPPDAY